MIAGLDTQLIVGFVTAVCAAPSVYYLGSGMADLLFPPLYRMMGIPDATGTARRLASPEAKRKAWRKLRMGFGFLGIAVLIDGTYLILAAT